MNWQNIINNSEFVYASAPDDKGFITWSLKKTICDVSYYESFPLETIDTIILSAIQQYEGDLSYEKLATFLGFNVLDDFEIVPKRYKDSAEVAIFDSFLLMVSQWGLIFNNIETKKVEITSLGYKALAENKKYRFYTGKKNLFENFGIKPSDNIENLFFPYNLAFGLHSDITDTRKIGFEKIDISEVFDKDENELIKRHNLQSKSSYNIFESAITKYFIVDRYEIDIRLYKNDNEYFPIIFYNNQVCVEATDLLFNSENANLKEKKIEWGLYLKLIKDSNAVLSFEAILPFEDLLELDSLIKDTRLVWDDERLFDYITQRANANQWHSISNHCPIDVIKLHIEKYYENWDWTSLSLRIDDKYLLENAIKFPWNFEAISSKENSGIEILKILLLIPELKQQEWNWDNIMPKLDFDFIKSNIDEIDFELSELTKTTAYDIKSLIIQYPNKRWNWTYISANYELSYILNNFLVFKTNIRIKEVINRAFTSEEYVTQFCNSTDFQAALIEFKETVLADYSPNQAKYIWTSNLIDLLENSNYLNWESGTYTLGFECNSSINWSHDFFRKYQSKVKTLKGYSFVSRRIIDKNIVLENIDFNWDWNKISSNVNLVSDKAFVFHIANKLNFSILLQNIDSDTLELLFDKSEILSFLNQNPTSWQYATEKASIEFVRKHIDFNWDWSIITKRFYAFIKIETFENPKWIDKWDWDYLTTKFEKEIIINNISKYNNYWNWKILLTSRLDKSDLLPTSHLLEIAKCISTLSAEFQKELWQIITRRFDYTELEALIVDTQNNQLINLDYGYFYELQNFNIRNYLQKFSEYVNWKELSACKKLELSFRFDDKILSEEVWRKDIIQQLDKYDWDFHSLSKNTSINSDYLILNKYKKHWDWDCISLYSDYFIGLNRDKRKLKSFQQNLNFLLLSQRENTGLTERIIADFIENKWDWDALSGNSSIQFSKEFIVEHNEKNWNWSKLSIRNDIKFDNETLVKLSDKEWDWEAISNRVDISFSGDIIVQFKDKPLNWKVLSQNKSFVPNATTLSILRGKELDWVAISKNENLSTDCFWAYKENLNWKNITKNKIFEISDSEILSKYQDYIDWQFISNSNKFKLTEINLKRFKNQLNWNIINSRNDFSILEEILEPFADVLDWSKVSQSMNISITEQLIEKHKTKWDWSLLRKNPQVIERLETSLKKYAAEFNCADFVENFNENSCIYHFTHLFNAIDIIQSRKILSRNKAEGNFANAAGGLVERRSTAHDFARFYFRTQTPTQFYNECLGMDSESGEFKTWTYWDGDWINGSAWKSYYPQAKNLGLPKCPMPVFFKFDLKEVIRKMPNRCYYSTGNMQTNWAKVEKVAENPHAINTEYLYSDASDYENYKQYSQQEFLIEEEFDFSLLDSFEIICYDENQASLLKSQLGDDPICEKINSNDQNMFHRRNRSLRINVTDAEVSILSEYRDNAYLSIQGEGLKYIQILNPEKIKKETEAEIIADNEIRFTKTNKPLEVHFIDKEIGTRDWLIYKSNAYVNPMEKQVQNLNWWYNLDYNWKKQIYLNYMLSKQDVSCRNGAFLDDSYGLEFILCEIFKFESDNPNDDLVKFNVFIQDKILKIDKEIAKEILFIEELCLQGVNNLKPLEHFLELKLVYLDHCKIDDINSLNNLNKLQFYETPEYPTNTPSLYLNSNTFSKNVKIIQNPFIEVNKYFDKKRN